MSEPRLLCPIDETLEQLAEAMQRNADQQATAYPGASKIWAREAQTLRDTLHRLRYGCPRLI